MENKNFLIIVSVVTAILFIPLTAMQFTDEVNWTLSDFVVAGILLFGTGLILDLAIRKVTNPKFRVGALVAILVLFFFTWAELAVGILGTPLSGN